MIWMRLIWAAAVTAGLAAVNKPLEVRIMAVGGQDGGKMEHGTVAGALIRFRNLSNRNLSVPLAPLGLGKNSDPSEAASYRATDSDGFSGFIAPRIFLRFEDSAGRPVTPDYPLTLPDIPKLASGGWTTFTVLFPAPLSAGHYRMRMVVDNRKLRSALTSDPAPHGEDVFIDEEIVLNQIEVK
jgi:hypothetical protein